MATGWARDGAVQDQIDDSIRDAVEAARARLPTGPGATQCEECGEPIPEARRQAVPHTDRCAQCAYRHESRLRRRA